MWIDILVTTNITIHSGIIIVVTIHNIVNVAGGSHPKEFREVYRKISSGHALTCT